MSSSKIVQKRNIVVVGKTGSGKSTIANCILGKDIFVVARSVAGVTKRPQYEETQYTKDDTLYSIKMVDTVGLMDLSKSNQDTLRETKEFFKKNSPEGISLVLFVIREGRYGPDDKETFELLAKNFKKEKVTDISALVVTFCENYDKTEREALVRDLSTSASTKSMCDFMKKGIFPVGFPPAKKAKESASAVFAESSKEDAESLGELVRTCGDEMLLTEDLLSDSFWDKVVASCQIL